VTEAVRNIKYSITNPPLPLRNRRHCHILDHTLDRNLDHIPGPPYCLWHSRVAFLQLIPLRVQELLLLLYRCRPVSGGQEPVEPVEEDIAEGGKAAADSSPDPGFADNHHLVEGNPDSLGCRSPEGDPLQGPTILAEVGHRNHPPNAPEDNHHGQRENLNHGVSDDAGTSSEIWNVVSNGSQAGKREAVRNLREALLNLRGGSRNCEVVMP